MLLVLVKGNVRQVLRAAESRGIAASVHKYGRPASGAHWIQVADADAEAVGKWYGEPGSAPFEPGTCLHYQQREA